jgi:hypothetical protein
MDAFGNTIKTRTDRVSPWMLQNTYFGDRYHVGPHNSTLQLNQFSKPDRETELARQALSYSARAHSLGMKDEALAHFSKAVEHAGNAAEAINESRRTAGVRDVSAAPESDWEHEDRLMTGYRNSWGN